MQFLFKSRIKKLMSAAGFSISDEIFSPPWFSFLPHILHDDQHKRWAIVGLTPEPELYSYADIVSVNIVEAGAELEQKELEGVKLAEQLMLNPERVSKINAAKKNFCLGIFLVLKVRTSVGIHVREIPIFQQELKRDSGMYQRMCALAEEVKDRLLALQAAGERPTEEKLAEDRSTEERLAGELANSDEACE